MTLAFAGVVMSSCSSDDDEPVVGIQSGTITPLGSSVSYTLSPKATGVLENTTDSVAWDATDAVLSEATLKVTPTLNATVTYNGQPVGADGVVVNANAPINLTVTGEGRTVAYTVNVVRAKSPAEGFVKKASAFNGLPAGIVWMDVTVFKDKFYAYVVSTKIDDAAANKTSEAYQLFRSNDGITWSEVDYKVDVDKEVLGGEGARIFVFKDKLYVYGGSRLRGTDKYGNGPELDWGIMQSVKSWRMYCSSDGENFLSLLSTTKITDKGEAVADWGMASYNTPYASVAVLNGRLFIQGGYMYAMGQAQSGQKFISTTDGVNWTTVNPTTPAGESLYLPSMAPKMFAFKGKLWLIGGVNGFIDSDSDKGNKKIYSSTDGQTWKVEAETVSAFSNLYQASVVANDKVAYLFGGESFLDGTRMLSKAVYRSYDGVTWEKIDMPAAFTGARYSAVATMGQAAWFFGGYNSVSTGYYAVPGTKDTYGTDTWNAALK
ncbi:MAG: hypothetical protein SOY49_02980 [Prevotella sp.]|nr:hypothetical protein [Prevotella sp.]